MISPKTLPFNADSSIRDNLGLDPNVIQESARHQKQEFGSITNRGEAWRLNEKSKA
jgi:hypothetical protein